MYWGQGSEVGGRGSGGLGSGVGRREVARRRDSGAGRGPARASLGKREVSGNNSSVAGLLAGPEISI